MSPRHPNSAHQAASERGLVRELEAARAAAADAASSIRSQFRPAGWATRGGADPGFDPDHRPVTQADRDACSAILARLAGEFPDDALLCEEAAPDAGPLSRPWRGAPRVWVVDPLDGSHEFERGVPECAVSIALCVAGVPTIAAVHNPASGEVVVAVRGGGAWHADERLRISRAGRLADATFLASRSETQRGDYEPLQGVFGQNRPTGSVAWKLACIALARGHLTHSMRPKREWDVAAGDLLVREAGGVYLPASGAAPRYALQTQPRVPAGMTAGSATLVSALQRRVAAAARTA